MNLTKTLRILACAAMLLAVSAVSAPPVPETCCTRAKAAGKECDHICCKKAVKDKKVCEKCNPKVEKKEEAK